MLVLTRRQHESIVLELEGREVTVEILSVQGGRVKLGVISPPSVPVYRREGSPAPKAA